jgi:CRP-like cAMP-binding protein
MGKSHTVILDRSFVPQNGLVMRKDDVANCAYLIQSGSVGVYAEKDGVEVELAKLGTGDIFGEMALIHEDVRTANVRALEDCNFIIITRQVFLEKLAASDATIKAVVEMFVRRLIHLNDQVTNNLDTPEDLANSAEVVFERVLSGLDNPKDAAKFEVQVQPKLDALLAALKPYMRK